MLLWQYGFLQSTDLYGLITTDENLSEVGRRPAIHPPKSKSEAISALCRIEDRSAAVDLLVALKDSIPDDLLSEADAAADLMIRGLWEVPVDSPSEDPDPVSAIQKLGTLLSSESLSAVIELLEKQAWHPPYEDAGWRLARMAVLATDRKGLILEEAERRYRAALPGLNRDRALSALILVAKADRIAPLLAHYQQLHDYDEIAKLRFLVAPHLGLKNILDDIATQGKNARLRSLARMFQVLVATLDYSEMKAFVVAASELASEWWVVEALTEIIEDVEDSMVLLQILNIVTEIRLADLRSRLASRVISRLAQLGAIDTAVEVVDRIEIASERWRNLADFVERLSSQGHFGDANVLATMIEQPQERSRAYAFLALHQARFGLELDARATAENVELSVWSNWVNQQLSLMSPQTSVPPPITSESVSQQAPGMAIVRDVQESWFETLEVLANKQPRWRKLMQFINENSFHDDLSAFWSSSPDIALSFFQTKLTTSRHEVAKTLRDLVPILGALGCKEDLLAIEVAAKNVARWWP
jgi:hypothetical protein